MYLDGPVVHVICVFEINKSFCYMHAAFYDLVLLSAVYIHSFDVFHIICNTAFQTDIFVELIVFN